MREARLHPIRGARVSQDGDDLTRYLRVLRERLWLIALCTVIAVGGAVAYVKLAPKTYEAKAEMLVQPASSNDAVLTALPVLHQSGDPTEDVLTAASLVTTTRVANAVASSLKPRISAGTALADVTASPIGQAGLVAVQATASSPRLAQGLANAFVTETIAISTASMHAAIQNELPGLQSQVAAIPSGQRFGAGSLGQQLIELQQLLRQNDPTLMLAAPASLPTGQSSPQTKLTLVAALLGGLLLGIGAAFALNVLDPRLRREEQLRETVVTPVLARIGRERRRITPLLPRDLSMASQEGYRTLRTMLTARGSGESRAVLITGSGPGEGKSTTAISLASAFAQTGADVILIEADLRRPTFSTVFGLSDYVSIDKVLRGEVALEDALEAVVIEDSTVQVLAAHPNSAELATRVRIDQVEQLMREAASRADFVVIDSPPLTAVVDALPFAQMADDIIVVARLGQSRVNRLVELDELLRQNGTMATGFVVIGDSTHVEPYYGNPTKGGKVEPTRGGELEETSEEQEGELTRQRRMPGRSRAGSRAEPSARGSSGS